MDTPNEASASASAAPRAISADGAAVPQTRRSGLRLSVGAGVILVLVGAGVAVVVAAISPHGEVTTVGPASSVPAARGFPSRGAVPSAGATVSPTTSAASRKPLFVHILGAVNKPGLYELRDGDRAIDAVAAAGGLTPAADQTQLNLARFISDGEQIIVPVIGQTPTPGAGSSGVPGVGGAKSPGSKININTADVAALEELPGVGPALAQRMVDFRAKNGRFSSVDDLLNVSGIGEKTLDRFRDNVTV